MTAWFALNSTLCKLQTIAPLGYTTVPLGPKIIGVFTPACPTICGHVGKP